MKNVIYIFKGQRILKCSALPAQLQWEYLSLELENSTRLKALKNVKIIKTLKLVG